MTAKQSRFKEAALLAQEAAAAEKKGESQAMLFATLQEQHDKQIAAMTPTNKANMEAMLDRMNSLIAGRGGDRCTPTQQPDKENASPGGNIPPPTNLDWNKNPGNKKPSVPTAKH